MRWRKKRIIIARYIRKDPEEKRDEEIELDGRKIFFSRRHKNIFCGKIGKVFEDGTLIKNWAAENISS